MKKQIKKTPVLRPVGAKPLKKKVLIVADKKAERILIIADTHSQDADRHRGVKHTLSKN